MKVVFDANVYLSALTLPGRAGDHALRRVIDGSDSLAISKPIVDELLAVMARKFARDREELARVAVLLSSLAELVEPTERFDALADEPDNRILKCALSADSEVVVSGDRAIPDLREFRGIRIKSVGDYLEGEPSTRDDPDRDSDEERVSLMAGSRR